MESIVDEYLECLKKQENGINKRSQAFLNSIKKVIILENENSYREMVRKVTATAEKIVSILEEKMTFDEEILEEYINLYSDVIEEFSKYQVIFIGDDNQIRILSQFVDSRKAHILINREYIPDYCDYVIILDSGCSLPNISEHSRIIRLDRILVKFQISPETAYYDKKLRDTLGSKKGYVTGLSYEQKGIFWDEIKFDLGCLAAPSQDLFVDTLSYMEIYNKTKEKYGMELEYCVLGMSFWALWYDLSLSEGSPNMLCFYERIGSLHHLDANFSIKEELLSCREIFLENFLDRYYEAGYQEYINLYVTPNIKEYNPAVTYKDDIQEIERIYNKPYENTFKENVGILKRFFKFLSFHEIKTIVYIPPFPELFNEYTPENMRQRTLSFLYEMKKEFRFEILDLSTSKEFDNTCFRDWSHLNTKGAKKATKLLNQFMDEVWT